VQTVGEKTLVRVLGLNKLFWKVFAVRYTTRTTDFPNIDHSQKNSPALQRPRDILGAAAMAVAAAAAFLCHYYLLRT
jgi:hypothetical protein